LEPEDKLGEREGETATSRVAAEEYLGGGVGGVEGAGGGAQEVEIGD